MKDEQKKNLKELLKGWVEDMGTITVNQEIYVNCKKNYEKLLTVFIVDDAEKLFDFIVRKYEQGDILFDHIFDYRGVIDDEQYLATLIAKYGEHHSLLDKGLELQESYLGE